MEENREVYGWDQIRQPPVLWRQYQDKEIGLFESTIRNLLKEYTARGKVDVLSLTEDYSTRTI